MSVVTAAGRHRYDKTQARRQAKRREQFTRMRDALRAIETAESLADARDIARAGLRDEEIAKDAD